jgi:arsenite methyltransferase
MSMTPASAQYFHEHASQWDKLRTGYFGESVRAAAFARAYLRPDMTAADIGGGTGFISAGLAPLVHKVHLVDASQPMLEVARQNLAQYSNVEFHHADGLTLPLPDGSVDVVFANMYLHHCPEPLAAIQEMARLLRPGGRLIITDLDSHSHAWMKAEMADVWQGFEREQVRAWYAAAGLVNTLVESTEQSCCTCGEADLVEISVFVAVGTRRQPMRAAVQENYGALAQSGQSCCAPPATESLLQIEVSQPCCTPSALSAAPASSQSGCCSPTIEPEQNISYLPADLLAAPAEAAEFSLGCGSPFALQALQPGETVLDIGSGGGLDAFIAARQVGEHGRVIGVDMTPAMLERATAAAQRAGLTNVEFRHGYAEALPVEDASIDVILSNCVINLAEDKGLVFREAFRSLKPGGRLQVSDIVSRSALPVEIQHDPQGWSACISGALPEAEYVSLVQQAGFGELSLARSESVQAVYSLVLSARKPLS